MIFGGSDIEGTHRFMLPKGKLNQHKKFFVVDTSEKADEIGLFRNL
jgi:hypothetical protein